ncbi:MAG: M20/M25/M40 family metallo-hydrolase [Thermodesulfobacteriota bacterium]|nr:M20/M25/M40 family metallo-hydrolase [Thermodesulfobacteriota bacterium]
MITMHKRINRDRLADTFRQLVSIDSPSREEGAVADWIKRILKEEMGAEVTEDQSHGQTGSESGNIIARIPGTGKIIAPLFFNAHMDTVEPGRGIKIIFKNGIFQSDGTTVLGADDKAAIAILIETARLLKKHRISHGPIEFLFTVCEEIGLLGAKSLDPDLLEARAGYALDSSDPDVLINQAPCAIRFKVRIIGKAAHAGLHPELGINAIQVAARALAEIPLGRIDEYTTANVGLIHGGKATNIVPEEVELEGEVRSHNPEKLREVQDQILETFHKIALDFKPVENSGLPLIKTDVIDDYPLMSVSEGHPLITTAVKAAKGLGRKLSLDMTGGGSDANIFNAKGLATVVMGIGMQNVHTTSEHISLDDMVAAAELVLEIIRMNG